MIRLLLLACLLAVTACSRFSARSDPPAATLADLQPVAIPQEQQQLPQVSLAQLAEIYREVLQENQDPRTRLLVLHRLADIEMLDSEAGLAAAAADEAFFAQAIAAYEGLLRDNPDYPLNDRVLYQLSKAYDLSGYNEKSLAVLERLSAEHAQSGHIREAEFRKAESYFADADYVRAEAAYTRVIAYGRNTAYYSRSLYMQGWSRFKQDRYQAAIASFTGTLDQLMPADNEVSTLPRGEHELVLDCLRVMAVVFSYLEGTQTIATAYEQLGVRPYQHLMYEALGDLYLSQERYRDSAETYKTYTRRFPDSGVAHLFQLRVIDAYEAGGFPDLIVAAKQDYVQAFGVYSQYWLRSESRVRDVIRPRLQLFIVELASYYHALAQTSGGAGDRTALAVQHYLKAADYYQLFLDSFPEDPRVPNMGFLLAESRFEAGDYVAASKAFEWVAYRFPAYDKAADAGYAAILAYQRLAQAPAAADQSMLQQQRIDSELRFASRFEDDARAPGVLAHAATELLRLADYQSAIIAASTLTRWQPQLDSDLMVPAWLVMGHGHFELQQYAGAEQAFHNALAVMGAADRRYPDTVERVAASIYRQAEEAVANNQYLAAARQFDRVSAVAPASAIRANAQFDAATNYMRAGELSRANVLLIDFRERFPRHDLTTSIGSKLVANYEQLGQWLAAALELDALYAAQPPGELKRQALYAAAEYYDKVNERERAIQRYRSYAHEWPEPLAQRMEAMHRLAQLYQLTKQQDKRQFWLQKLMASHDAAGAGQSARSLYLAAESASVVADNAYRDFLAIRLRHPLKPSLRTKKSAMERALSAYNRSNDYGIEQFSTLATYRLGRIYHQLSSDLISSERPGNLDALALEQYELLLEEQAYPFEEKAIAIHESNARRSWDDVYDQWVKESFAALAELLPARYLKVEALGDPDAAAGEQEAIRSYPGEVDSYNLEAMQWRQQGRFGAAEQAYLAALAEWEPHAATHRNIGILYDLYRGEQDKALQHFHRYQALTDGTDRTVAGWIADLERRQMLLVQGD